MRKGAVTMSFLPTEKTKPETEMTKYITLIYGDPKVGKSTFCSRMDDPLFIATEAGLHALEVFQVETTTWEDFIKVCADLHKSERFRTVIIDTVDNLYQECVTYVCKKHNITHPQDLDYGKGWGLVNTEFQRVIIKLSMENRGLVFVSHAQRLALKTRTAEVTKAVPTMPNSARRFLLGLADIILYAEVIDDGKGPKRIIHAEPSENWEAGDRTGKLPAVMPLDYSAVVKSFKGGK
jgi:hypothetical protein